MSRIGNLGDGPLRPYLLDQSLCSEPFPWACLRGVIEAKTAERLAQCFPSASAVMRTVHRIATPADTQPFPLALRLSVWVLKDVTYALQQGLW